MMNNNRRNSISRLAMRWLGMAATGVAALAMLSVATPASAADQNAKTSCESCHSNKDMFEGDQLQIPAHWAAGVHAKNGISCHDCHGGNPDPKLADDMVSAMDPKYKPNPYVGAPARKDIPEFCGKCHSDTEYMRKYNPTPRVDQVKEYWTSQHGIALKTGDKNVATCIDCHGLHGIRKVDDPDSPVYPTKVADTCGKCHADAARMKGYTDKYGDPIPVDIVAKWKRSVHANAMYVKGDLTAPTCNDCHGNHGAVPPGVDSVVYVCGQCHGRETDLFRASRKFAGFETHNKNYLTDGADCSTCHEGIAAPVLKIRKFSECVTCHENHAVIRPTVGIFGSLPETPCAMCHEGTGPLAHEFNEPPGTMAHYKQVRDGLLALAKQKNLEGNARFDWLVDQAQKLSTHTEMGDDGKLALRPEFGRLFEKFRIGKTHYTYTDPKTKKEVSVKIRQCTDCHVDKDGTGHKTAVKMLGDMRELTGSIARAQRILLRAEQGGVEVGKANADLDKAVDSQIQLEVLVHTFDSAGDFAKQHAEGTKAAKEALTAGRSSLAELAYRRKGLLIALGIIILVLIALGLKIRQMGS